MSPLVEKLLSYGTVGLFAAIVCAVFVYYYNKQQAKEENREKRDIAEREDLKKKNETLQTKYDEDIAEIQKQRLEEARDVAKMAISLHEKTITALSANTGALNGVDTSLKELWRGGKRP